jgi:hypothetical protein
MSGSQSVAIQNNSTSNANTPIANAVDITPISRQEFMAVTELLNAKINEIIDYIKVKLVKQTDIAATLPGYSTVNAAWRKGINRLHGIQLPQRIRGGSKTRKKKYSRK